MPGEDVEVAAKCLHIDRDMGHRLTAIEQDLRTHRMGPANDVFDRQDRPHNVRHMRDRHELRLRSKQRLERRHDQFAIVADRRDLQHDALLVTQHLPRHDVRMMLKLGDDDLIARLEELAPETVGQEVDRFRRVARENNLVGVGGIDVLPDRLAGPLIARRHGFADLVEAAMNIRVLGLVCAGYRVDHLARLLRRRRAVEKRQRLVVHGPAEDREIGPYRIDVVFGRTGLYRGWRRHEPAPSGC